MLWKNQGLSDQVSGWGPGSEDERGRGSESALNDSTMVDTCGYTFIQTHRIKHPEGTLCNLQTLGDGVSM